MIIADIFLFKYILIFSSPLSLPPYHRVPVIADDETEQVPLQALQASLPGYWCGAWSGLVRPPVLTAAAASHKWTSLDNFSTFLLSPTSVRVTTNYVKSHKLN